MNNHWELWNDVQEFGGNCNKAIVFSYICWLYLLCSCKPEKERSDRRVYLWTSQLSAGQKIHDFRASLQKYRSCEVRIFRKSSMKNELLEQNWAIFPKNLKMFKSFITFEGSGDPSAVGPISKFSLHRACAPGLFTPEGSLFGVLIFIRTNVRKQRS